MRYVFFSDLDGTLLDHVTYSMDASMEGVNILRERGSALVLVSSKTLEEIKHIHRRLHLSSPIVFENGGGIFWPEDSGRIEVLGSSADELRRKRETLESIIGGPARFIDEMDINEIMLLTGLSPEDAARAQARTASLPFVTDRAVDIQAMTEALTEHGAAVTRGGRFYHLVSSRADKGKAVRKIMAHYHGKNSGAVRFVGIGDSENDVAMLRVVDLPFLVRRPDGSAFETGIIGLQKTRGVGPAGFTEAVKSVFSILR
jgi:mannosyl-3-phosphoglycerate phosphatase